MATFTLADLRPRVRQRANAEDDGNFISDAELDIYINDSIADGYDLELESEAGNVYVVNAPVLTKTGEHAYQLPTDFYKLRNMSYYIGGTYYRMCKADPSDFAQLTTSPPNVHKAMYDFRKNPTTGTWTAYVFPKTIEAANLAITYVPKAPELSTDTETWDGNSGWQDYVIVKSAIKCLAKEESDTSALTQELAQIASSIRSQSSYNDTGEPTTIRKRHGLAGWDWTR